MIAVISGDCGVGLASTLPDEPRHRPVEQRYGFDRKHGTTRAEQRREALGRMHDRAAAVAMGEEQPAPSRRAPGEARECLLAAGPELHPVAPHQREHVLVGRIRLRGARHDRRIPRRDSHRLGLRLGGRLE